jgi:hypothetical protein
MRLSEALALKRKKFSESGIKIVYGISDLKSDVGF